eukprot:TRINITY_DN5332_c0_g1_i1.p1 TRINITY_DN5332_c0_g1~~TRINITY_DN5332_c0_g1_i1.p1  ORF type:complete len:711 (+),score=180.30 TRINITY_DN5332_c0_g1_i1:135-2267(+)
MDPSDSNGKQGNRPWLTNSGNKLPVANSPNKLMNSIIGTLKVSSEPNTPTINAPARSSSTGSVSAPTNSNSSLKRVPSFQKKKGLQLKFDINIGEGRITYGRDFDLETVVSEVIREVLSKKSRMEYKLENITITIPPCFQYKSGMILDHKKKLADYDDDGLMNHPLEIRMRPATLRDKPKAPSLRGKEIIRPHVAPAPKKFLADPNARITVNYTGEGANRSVALTFDYTDPDAEWYKPDYEGDLLKKGTRVGRTWNSRWMIIAGNRLYVFKKGKGDEPDTTFVLKGGSITRSSNSKPYSMDITAFENVSQKMVNLTLAAQNAEDFNGWYYAFENAIHKQVTASVVSTNLSISFTPQEGYVGLPNEWKQMLSNCGITERYFYEKPEEVIQMLRYYRSTVAEPITVQPVSKTIVNSIDEVVNKEVSPDMIYEDFVLIGSGTFGEVYRATNKRSQQKVAIKKMLLTPKREPLFISEINVQRNTEHPNVVKLFDAYKVDDHIWVALEFMEGGNLYQILSSLEESKQLLTEPQIAYIITESLKALSYIHGMHRIHRDIKSDNILVGRNAEIKLADFGYAVQLSGEDEKRTTMAGSPYWMAPEIIEGEEYGKEIDIWSLGIMLMECCDLQPPYINEPPSKALMLITTQDPPPLARPERWSRELKHFVNVCLQRDPRKRPMSIELLQHPLLRSTCVARDFRDSVLSGRKNAKPCLIQ